MTRGHRTVSRSTATALVATIALLAGAGVAHAAYDPSDPAQKVAYDQALKVGTHAYQYGVPLLDMQKTYATSTSVNVTNGRGGGPVNQFNHFAGLANAKDRKVVAPNADTLYSMAWLDLGKQPLVIHMPKTTRFHVLEMLSPYEENFANIGSPNHALPDGDYLVTGPGYRGATPKGLTRIRSPYDRIWIIGRTEVFGQSDVAKAEKIMHTYRITPLSRWNPKKPDAYTPPKPKKADRTINTAVIPGTGPGQDAATFFDALGDALKQFPPPKADAARLAEIATLGIGPGLHPTTSGTLSDAQLQGLRDAVTGGPAILQANVTSSYLNGFEKHNGWLVTTTGHYGTDYLQRATVDKVGLGAPTPNVAVYPFTQLDRTKAQLTGAKSYVVHFVKGAFPVPVKFFWSLTMYDADGFFVDNPLDRYLVNDRSKLHFNADGSLDIYVQRTEPASATARQNWLPAPAGNFRLNLRLYGLSDSGITKLVAGTGWPLPTVNPVAAPA